MKTITVPEKEQLSFGAQSILGSIEKKMGKIPNLYATIGYSSSALKSLLETEASLVHDSSFTAKEREAINLVVSQVNECEYCLAAHTTLAKMRGFTEEDTLEVRKGSFSDSKLDAIIKLAQSIANNKGNAGNGDLENFFNAGYDVYWESEGSLCLCDEFRGIARYSYGVGRHCPNLAGLERAQTFAKAA